MGNTDFIKKIAPDAQNKQSSIVSVIKADIPPLNFVLYYLFYI